MEKVEGKWYQQARKNWKHQGKQTSFTRLELQSHYNA
jgi:hypothetical protein